MRRQYIVPMILLVAAFSSFQNCARTSFGTSDSALSSNSTDGIPTTTTTTTASLKAFKPVLAVGGINCMACHGVVSSNIVTDFGMSSGNFINSNAFFGVGNRTAYNDNEVNDPAGGWGSLSVAGGSVIVPQIALTADQVKAMSGINQAMSMAELMTTKINSRTMIDHVTPAAGEEALIEYSNINIAYPSASEILALVPSSMASQAVAVSAINVAGQPASTMSGFALDSSGNFVRNALAPVICKGDVIVKGPLFLKDLNLQTDAGGCRLYVSQSVFIQGPITYSGSTLANLQITSARGIIMGISAVRMGYAGAGASTVRVNNNSLTTPGGPWARFLPSNDVAYSPGNALINGVARSTFFDNMTADAAAIGAELLDAGDAAAVNNLAPGETTSTEPNTSENGQVGGTRVSIDFNHLLLNAPHVHSRYAGSFQGSIVADVAMLARNPSAQTLEKFEYDPIFSEVSTVLPALTTNILTLEK